MLAIARSGNHPSPRAPEPVFGFGMETDEPEVLAFLEFILTDGQQYAPEVGYIGFHPIYWKKNYSNCRNNDGGRR